MNILIVVPIIMFFILICWLADNYTDDHKARETAETEEFRHLFGFLPSDTSSPIRAQEKAWLQKVIMEGVERLKKIKEEFPPLTDEKFPQWQKEFLEAKSKTERMEYLIRRFHYNV